MRVLVCGSRNWGVGEREVDPWNPLSPQLDPSSSEAHLVFLLLDGLAEKYGDALVIIHGCAPGADSAAWWWAIQNGKSHLPFPANWFDEKGQFRKWAGPERNKIMLEKGAPDRVIAFTDDLSSSKGTLNMCTIAEAAGVPVSVFGNPGRLLWE